jgi:hypothetical protein
MRAPSSSRVLIPALLLVCSSSAAARALVPPEPALAPASTPAAPPNAAAATELAPINAAAATELAPPNAALGRALESVVADEIRSDVFFIASDQMAGRDTPSLGLQVTARYIRARLERLGWKPGAEDGYFHTYPLAQTGIDAKASTLRAQNGERSVALALGADYFFASRDTDAFESVLETGAVWCGTGEDEDFDKAKPAGRWAVCFDRGERTTRIARAARSAGAGGLILVEAPDAKESYASRYGRPDALRPTVSFPRARAAERGSSDRTRLPRILLGRGGLERVLALSGKSGSALQVGEDLGVRIAEDRKLLPPTIELENVCGFWPGDDPVLSKEVVIVSAHYDHVGMQGGEIHNGADDNGSGTSGLLAIAHALTRYGPLRRSVLLLWVSGEEKGLWGSKAWNESPWLPEGCKAVCDVNIDMIGRNAPDQLLVTPTETHPAHNGIVKLVRSLAPLEGFPTLGSADKYYERSDHINFAKKGIPAIFLFSDVHEDYHEAGDDPEKVDNDKIRRVTRLVLRLLDALQADELGA